MPKLAASRTKPNYDVPQRVSDVVTSGWGLSRRTLRAFTLLEIMVVVGIIGIAMVIGIPSFVRMAHKEGMRSAISDFLEAAGQARANAILSGKEAELIIHPKTGVFETSGQVNFSATMPSQISIEILGVNFVEMQEADSVHVHFQPNATCDEFTMVLKSDEMEYRRIDLEVTTGLVSVEEPK